MPTQKNEEILIENWFGTVTTKRVVWARDGSREDIPLKHVTSVRLETARNLKAVIFLWLAVGVLWVLGEITGQVGFQFGCVAALALALLNIWGSPLVVVNTAGRDLGATRGFPWHKKDASAFVEALRGQLFCEE